MSLMWNDEQRAVRDSVRALLEKTVEVTAAGIGGADNAAGGRTWQRLADEVGAQAIGVPEDLGGVGFGFAEQAVVFAETGRLLGPRGAFSTMALAVPLLLGAPRTESSARLVADLAAGIRSATVAVTGPVAATGDSVSATQRSGQWRLDGLRRHVTDAAEAAVVLTPAEVDGEVAVFAVETSATGVTVESGTSLDPSRPLGDLRMSSAAAELVIAGDEATQLLAYVRHRGAVALAVEQIAGAQRCLDMATEYAGTRRQFGREIGSFQAVKHLLADVLVGIECAAAAVQHAIEVVDTGAHELRREAAIAGLLASEAYSRAAGVNIQVHGGIGFTWEHPAHLYFKRAASSRALLGSPSGHRETLAELALG